MEMEPLQQWLGKTTTHRAPISVEQANLMQATLNRPATLKAGQPLPPAWHWLYFHEAIIAVKLGVEGHEVLGEFMPPVSFGDDVPPRRMWAGGKISFLEPVRLGDVAQKRSTIASITPKEGRSGKLVFVVVEHEISVEDVVCIREERTIVYREPAGANAPPIQPPASPTDGQFFATYTPDPILLFRYSALTFNAHRIHYDVDFCLEHEGYPDLVVHGPLTATLLLDLFRQQYPRKRIVGFNYRGVSPLFNPNPFTVNGRSDGQAWASNHQGGLAMFAQVTY